MKKKTIFTALTATLSAVMVGGSLVVPTFATENNNNIIAGTMVNGNDVSTLDITTTTIPSSLQNGKEIAKVLKYNKAKELLPDLEWGRVMILYTDDTYDIVRLGNEDNCNFTAKTTFIGTSSDNYITSVHRGYPSCEKSIEIEIDLPWFGAENFIEEVLMPTPEEDEIDGYYIRKIGYNVYVNGEKVAHTIDPEVVKSYGFVGEKDEWGNYIRWTYNGELASDEHKLPTTTPPSKHGETITSSGNSNSSAKPHNWYTVGDNRQVTLWIIGDHSHIWWYEGGIIEESGDLNEQPETPDTPEVPEQPETPDTPEVPEQPETPDTPEVPEQPEIPDTPEVPEQPEIPDTPEVPEQPETPDTPEVPEQPEIPETPEVPEQPEIPETPEVPEQPETPDTPEVPEQPKEPVVTITTQEGHNSSAKEIIEFTIEFWD